MRERVAGLDLLRALAILGVLLSHSLPFLYSHLWQLTYGGHLGSMGVDLFFVLSGFLIGGMLWRIGPQLQHGRELGRFWVRRWLRTLPNYYVFFALTVVISIWVYHRQLSGLELVHVATFTQNLAWTIPVVFPESWTLAVEEWFYLLTPFAFWVGLKITGRFKLTWWIVLSAMLIVPFWLRAIQTLPSSWGSAGREPVVFRLDSLAMGVAMAALRAELPDLWQRSRRVTLVIGLIFVGWGYSLLYRLDLDHSWFAHTWLLDVIAFGYALLLPWAAEFREFKSKRVGASVRAVAIWSYSLYLCNVGVCVYLGYVLQQRTEKSLPLALGAFVAANVVSFVISALAYRFVETPFLRWRERLTHRRAPVPATAW